MKKIVFLSSLMTAAAVHAQPAPAPAAPQSPAPAAPKPATQQPTANAPSRSPATQTAPAPRQTQPSNGTAAAPANGAAYAAPPALTLEQRRQMELLANAERIDKANRELLAKNQELQVQNENLNMQINVIRRDKSSEGIWKGALAVIAGFLMGWFFSGSGRRKSSW